MLHVLAAAPDDVPADVPAAAPDMARLVDIAETVPNGAWAAPVIIADALAQRFGGSYRAIKVLTHLDGRLEIFAATKSPACRRGERG